MRQANEKRRYIVTSSLIGGAHAQNYSRIFKLILAINDGDNSWEIAIRYMWLTLTDDKSVLFVSGNGLVPSGTKPLPEPMLT